MVGSILPATAMVEPSIGRPMGKDKWTGMSAKLSTMSGDGPKSAYELAMERLRQKDKEASVDDRPLTDEQKAAIADARQFYTAKVAEREILHQAALPGVRTHEELDRLNEELRRDRERLATDRDRKIADIRGKKPT